MIGNPLGSIRVVPVHLREVGVVASPGETARHRQHVCGNEHVIELLRVAVEHERVALRRRRELDEVDQIRIDQVQARQLHLVGRRWLTLDRAHHIDVAVVDLKRVVVADRHDVLVGMIDLA